MKRRHFVLGTAAAGGALVVGWTLTPPRQRLVPARPLPAVAGTAVFNGWLRIGSDDRVVVVMAKSEMGQGVHTGLAMVLADELDADWARVAIEPSPVDRIYANLAAANDSLSFHPDDDGPWRALLERGTASLMRETGLMLTGGSTSLKDLWLPMRQAGAAARAMLVDAAAARWQVAAAEITVDAGVLRHGERRARFGELAEAAAALPLPRAPRLKSPTQFKLIGRPLPRLRAEAVAKADGSAGFGLDVVVPGMKYASVTMCPTLGGRVASFDAAAASALPGVARVLACEGGRGGSGGVAVIADRPWQALQALAAVQVAWEHGANAGLSSAALMRDFAAALDRPGAFPYRLVGEVEPALAGAARTVTAEYSVPFLAHQALEPVNCTVLLGGSAGAGRAIVWAPTQAPDIARAVAAAVLGLDEQDVELRVTYIGGGFGRRLDVDFVAQAAEIARALPGVPVQTFWTREQDTRHDFYRPACVARLRGGLDAAGRVLAWDQTSAGPAVLPEITRRWAQGMVAAPLIAKVQAAVAHTLQPLGRVPGIAPDKTTVEGAHDQPYGVPHLRVAHQAVRCGVPVGFWRSVGHSHQAFFKESFVDELALAAGQDAVAFRAALLQRHPRHLAVLQRAAALAGWGTALPPAPDGAAQARGVALHQSFGSIVAQVAEVSLGAGQAIRVHRVVCVIDCGTAVNPNLVRQQMDSGIVFGLAAALHGGVTIEDGGVRQGNFHDQPILRIGECPQIVTEIMPSTAPPEGVGEPGTPPIAPAVANALFALTGQRLRSLPLKLA